MHGALQSFLGRWHLLLDWLRRRIRWFFRISRQSRPSIWIIWTKLHLRAVYLDLLMQISHDTIHYEVYSKPGNAFAYLPLGSFHVRKTFSEFIESCLQREQTTIGAATRIWRCLELPSYAQCSPMLLGEIVYAFYSHARSRLVSLIYDVFDLVSMQSGFTNCLLFVIWTWRL